MWRKLVEKNIIVKLYESTFFHFTFSSICMKVVAVVEVWLKVPVPFEPCHEKTYFRGVHLGQVLTTGCKATEDG